MKVHKYLRYVYAGIFNGLDRCGEVMIVLKVSLRANEPKNSMKIAIYLTAEFRRRRYTTDVYIVRNYLLSSHLRAIGKSFCPKLVNGRGQTRSLTSFSI